MLLKLQRKQKGIGLLELMLALGLIAILIIMATRYYISAQRSTRVNQATSDCQAILAAIANYSAGGGGVSGLTMPSLQSAGLLPENFNNPYGNPYAIDTVTNFSDIPIIITGITKTDCTQFYNVNKSSVESDPCSSANGSADVTFNFTGGDTTT